MSDAPLDTLSGRLLAGRYRLGRRLAAGGMAQVWEATDEVLARRVAVKLLHTHLAADDSFVERFRREAIAAARLAHPSIVSIYDTCSEGDIEAIVMELVPGRTLRQLLDERKYLEPDQAVGIVVEVAGALEAAHRAGLVHRDVKPANILLSDDGRVLVADFGIAKAAAGADLTGTGTALGTAKYLAPEQVEGQEVDARADVYSLGVVLYECLCGRPPFLADTEAATALARLQSEPRRPRIFRAGIPKPLDDVVMRALARDPAGRYASAAEMRAALLALGRSSPRETYTASPLESRVPALDPDGTVTVRARPTEPTPPAGVAVRPLPTAQRKRNRQLPILIIVLLAVALIVAGILVSGTIRPSSAPSGTAPVNTPSSVRILGAAAFDPQGDGVENDAQLPNAIDGDPSTSWTTEGYLSRTFGTKQGVGIVLRLEGQRTLGTLEVISPTRDWAFSVYVADTPRSTLDTWGKPVASRQHVTTDTTTVELAGRRGGAVLIWITDLGDEPAYTHARIAEVRIEAK